MGIISCDDTDKVEFKPADYTVSGKVEKGPFVSGSTINLQPMDSKLTPTGSTFSSSITDNSGNFTFNTTTLETPYAQLTANGYYFNENKGALSIGTLSLRAVVDLSELQTVNVNILTHLKYSRIINLVKNAGKSYKEANKQAQQELLSAFGLQQFTESDAASYSITAGTPEAAALIAISSMILAKRSEAQVTEYLAKLSQEFGDNGTFSEETKNIMKYDRNTIINGIRGIEDNIKKRYQELGQTVYILPLENYFDWDDDGIAGNEFSDPSNPPKLSETALNVPARGGEYTITIDSDIQLYLDSTSLEGSFDGLEPLHEIVLENLWGELYDGIYKPGTIDTTLNGNTLRIVVHETQSRKTAVTMIPLFDIRGTRVATVTITQEGNPSLPKPGLGNDGQSVALGAFVSMSSAMKYMIEQVNDYGLDESCKLRAPLTTDNRVVSGLWGTFYRTINYINTLDWIDKKYESAFGPACSLFRSIAYYNMVTLWGGIPYVVEPSYDDASQNPYPYRMPEDELLDSLQTVLESILPELEERRIDFLQSGIEAFFSCKDIARILLADIYMYRNEYDKAKPYLNEVVSTGLYTFDTDYDDIIMGYTYGDAPNIDVIPLFTYYDVLLSIAECDYKLGDSSAAWQNARKIADATNTFYNTTEPDDLLEYISAIRKHSINCVGRFAFMKRTGLAKPKQSYYEFILLFPIPKDEIKRNPNLTQNPGYADDVPQHAD